MPPLEQWRVRFLWHVLAPLLVRRHGYLAWRRFGLGETCRWASTGNGKAGAAVRASCWTILRWRHWSTILRT